MTIYNGEICFVIGGSDSNLNPFQSVSRYNIGKDQWESGTPDLNIARKFAAACSLGDTVFVFAGCGVHREHLNSVERINVPAIASSGAAWELIDLP